MSIFLFISNSVKIYFSELFLFNKSFEHKSFPDWDK